MINDDFLDTPLDALDEASEEFTLRAKLMGYDTLREILSVDKEIYQLQDDYTQQWFNELIFLLKLFNREDLVQGIGAQAGQGHRWN